MLLLHWVCWPRPCGRPQAVSPVEEELTGPCGSVIVVLLQHSKPFESAVVLLQHSKPFQSAGPILLIRRSSLFCVQVHLHISTSPLCRSLKGCFTCCLVFSSAGLSVVASGCDGLGAPPGPSPHLSPRLLPLACDLLCLCGTLAGPTVGPASPAVSIRGPTSGTGCRGHRGRRDKWPGVGDGSWPSHRADGWVQLRDHCPTSCLSTGRSGPPVTMSPTVLPDATISPHRVAAWVPAHLCPRRQCGERAGAGDGIHGPRTLLSNSKGKAPGSHRPR